MSMRLTIVRSGDAFGSGSQFNTYFQVESADAAVLIDCGASSLAALRSSRKGRGLLLAQARARTDALPEPAVLSAASLAKRRALSRAVFSRKASVSASASVAAFRRCCSCFLKSGSARS
jgi:hypothetical protein